jgi:hypothetical protein
MPGDYQLGKAMLHLDLQLFLHQVSLVLLERPF